MRNIAITYRLRQHDRLLPSHFAEYPPEKNNTPGGRHGEQSMNSPSAYTPGNDSRTEAMLSHFPRLAFESNRVLVLIRTPRP
jgi:hypothetical protein